MDLIALHQVIALKKMVTSVTPKKGGVRVFCSNLLPSNELRYAQLTDWSIMYTIVC